MATEANVWGLVRRSRTPQGTDTRALLEDGNPCKGDAKEERRRTGEDEKSRYLSVHVSMYAPLLESRGWREDKYVLVT
jgi:hypothetical protein